MSRSTPSPRRRLRDTNWSPRRRRRIRRSCTRSRRTRPRCQASRREKNCRDRGRMKDNKRRSWRVQARRRRRRRRSRGSTHMRLGVEEIGTRRDKVCHTRTKAQSLFFPTTRGTVLKGYVGPESVWRPPIFDQPTHRFPQWLLLRPLRHLQKPPRLFSAGQLARCSDLSSHSTVEGDQKGTRKGHQPWPRFIQTARLLKMHWIVRLDIL